VCGCMLDVAEGVCVCGKVKWFVVSMRVCVIRWVLRGVWCVVRGGGGVVMCGWGCCCVVKGCVVW